MQSTFMHVAHISRARDLPPHDMECGALVEKHGGHDATTVLQGRGYSTSVARPDQADRQQYRQVHAEC